MQIQNNNRSFQYLGTAQSAQKSPASGGTFHADLTPGQQAEQAAWERAQREHPPLRDPDAVWGYSSPSMQMGDDYAAWKAQQPEGTPPDPEGGLTEENLSYLEERYSGSLSWNQKLGALEDLYKMGILDKDQCYEAVGDTLEWIILTPDDPAGTYIDRCEISSWAKHWEGIYLHSPATGFERLEDILNWVAGQENQ